jgi:hypothetical protein
MNEKNDIILKISLFITIIIVALILKSAVINRNKTLDSISVTGLGTIDFTSDEIFWSGTYSVEASNAKDAYKIILENKEKVKNFFISKGFKENEFTFSGVNFSKKYREIIIEKNNRDTRYENVFDGYTASQSVSFSAKANPELMKKIEKVADQTSELINLGVEFTPNPIQYTYSKLSDLKHNLIELATKDARERVLKIVNTADGRVGKLKKASLGVFQITGKNSDEDYSYGGVYDIYSKEKTARITVRLEYQLE